MYSGDQYETLKTMEGVVVGYLLRVLECSHEPLDVIERMLVRTVAEMRLSGIPNS